MKQISILVLILTMVACGGADKKDQLAALKKQQTEINEQIKALEAELNAGAKDTGENAKQVILTDVTTAAFNHYVEIQGKLDGDDNVGVTAQAMGIVRKIFVRAGQTVKKGQILAELDAAVYEQTLKELEASSSFVNDLYERQKGLWEKKVGSEVQYLQAKNNKESLENKIRTVKEQLAMTKITAPIAGTIEDAPLKVGQAVQPGINVFRITNFGQLKVVADVSETYASIVKEGNRVMVLFPDIAYDMEAKIDFASKFINPVNRSFQIEIHFSPKASAGMKANMVAVVKINDYSNANAISLPINWVQTDSKGSFVFVAANNGQKLLAERRPVSLGVEYNGMVEVRSGLQAGDKIVSVGYQDLVDKQPIVVATK